MPPEAWPVATGIGSRAVGIPAIPPIPAIPAIPPAGLGTSGGEVPAFGSVIPAIPPIPLMPPMLEPDIPGIAVAFGSAPLANAERPDATKPMLGLVIAFGLANAERPDATFVAPAAEAAEAAPVTTEEAADPTPAAALDARLGIAFAGLTATAETAEATPDTAETAPVATEEAADPKPAAALDARLGIAFAGLLRTVEATDATADAPEAADTTTGRLPDPLPSGPTQPLMPGRSAQRLDAT